MVYTGYAVLHGGGRSLLGRHAEEERGLTRWNGEEWIADDDGGPAARGGISEGKGLGRRGRPCAA